MINQRQNIRLEHWQWSVGKGWLGGIASLLMVSSGGAVGPAIAQSPSVLPDDLDLPEVCWAALDPSLPPQADLPLNSLVPSANPLATPTAPEQVEIIGTQPLTLEQAVAMAYRNSPSIDIARASLEQSQAVLQEAQGSLYPQVDLAAGSNVRTDSVLGASRNSPTVAVATGNVVADYELVTGGRRTAAVGEAELQARQQELALEKIQADVFPDLLQHPGRPCPSSHQSRLFKGSLSQRAGYSPVFRDQG
jgi:hypothetical protein